jgi:hypothetical protein
MHSGALLRHYKGALMASHAVASPLPIRAPATAARRLAAVDPVVRRLQLALAGLWLLDAVLQFQAFMFTRGFAVMLTAAARGNPAAVAAPAEWAAGLVARYDPAADAAFGAIQLLIAVGIAWRPTVKFALAASVAWSLAVWWLGEGLGGILNGTASPVNGAPGPVLLYALLAVLLWPRMPGRWPARRSPASFAAARFTGPAIAKLAWIVLWGSLACLALLPATRAPGALRTVIAQQSAGQPRWLSGIDARLAALAGQHGPAVAIGLAAVLTVIAIGVYLPGRARRAVLVLAVVTAAAVWIAQGLGGMLTGSGTDPNSGPLLALLAVAFWPMATAGPASPVQPAASPESGEME